MTELLYQDDCYLQECQSLVTDVDEAGHAVLLDRTIIYPGGGGQPADSGKMVFDGNSVNIVRARKGPEGIWHAVDPDSVMPQLGSKVTLKVDWVKRYQIMRTHSAMHILCGVVFRDYGAQVTGGDMEPLKGRMDFEFETLTRELIQVIETAVNREVQASRDIRIQNLPREQAFQIPDLIRTKINLLPPGIEVIRTVELVGLDLQADGGTHVRNTSEVGKLRIVDYKSKGKINKRIYVELD